jgi:hypothetical protein
LSALLGFVVLFFLFLELFNQSINEPLSQPYWKIVGFGKTPAAMIFQKEELFIYVFNVFTA